MSGSDLQALRTIIAAAATPPKAPDRSRPVLVYGAGNRGREVARALAQDGYDLAGFMDRGAGAHSLVDGLPCHPPTPVGSLGLSAPPSVVVAIFRHDLDVSGVYAQLKVLGFSEVIPFYELVERHPERFPDTWWQGSRERLPEWQDALERTFNSLADDESRHTFLECMRLRTGDVAALASPDRAHQYFPAGVLPTATSFRFVDCGAYDGDSWRNICDHGVHVESMAAFEPDPVNFSRLAARVRSDDQRPGDVLLMPCAVWSTTTSLHFSAGAAHNSHLDPGAPAVVQAVALDDVLGGFRPNWIKFDIEGAEIEALAGARRTIGAHRPFLAVACYHRADHLWRLPELIHGWDLGYRFYLRYHGYAGVDTVLYARAD